MIILTYQNSCGNTVQDTMTFTVGHSGVKPQAGIGVLTANNMMNVCSDIEFLGVGGGTYKWLFGDGDTTVSVNSEVSHKYKNTGLYNVRLIVMNGCGLSDTTQSGSNEIQINPNQTNVTDSSTCPGDSIFFYSNAGTNYLWKFGDGQQSSAVRALNVNGEIFWVINHAYSSKGIYKAVLSYTDGCSDNKTDTVTVHVTGNHPLNGNISIAFNNGSSVARPVCL